MTYAVQQDLIDRFGQQELIELTDRNNTGSIDATVLGKALADADATINGYLASRYTLPLSTVPSVIVRFAGDIARYYLYDDRVTEQVATRYADAIKFLKDVAAGNVNLGVDASNVAAAPTGGVQINAPDRVFTADSLSDYG